MLKKVRGVVLSLDHKAKGALVGTLLLAGQAQAAVPTEVNTAFADVATDVATYSALVIGAIITIQAAMLGFRLLSKMIKRAV